MANGFLDLSEAGVEVDEDILLKKIEYDKIFFNCYNTAEGKRMIEALRDRLVNVPIYVTGSTLEATSYRQGMCDVVKMIDACVEDARTPPSNGR